MSYYDAKQELSMMLRNGQIDEQCYCNELAALDYAHGEAMTRRDERQGVAA